MMNNRSVPVDAVLPHIDYKNLPRALEWICSTFGFVEHYHYGEPLSGAQVHLGKAFVMLGAARGDYRNPAQLMFGTQCLSIFVEDVEQHYSRTVAARASIVEPLHETVYGELQYGVRDLEGHLWVFSRHARDVDPAGWGATVVNPLGHRDAWPGRSDLQEI